MAVSVFDRVCQLFDSHGAEYEVTRHRPVYTSAEAAEVRGTSLASGAKALVCKLDNDFVMYVLPADRKLDSRLARSDSGARRLRFATKEEVLSLTGLEPGSIPPLGSLFHLPTLCDQALGDEASINFNAGDHAISVRIAFAEYCRVEQPSFGVFSGPPQ
ncbi:MAG: YbaK/EbsC family protein [Pirellulales bacterium]